MSQLEAVQNQDLAEEIDALNAIYEPGTIAVSRTVAAPHALDLGSSSSSNDHALSTTVTIQIPSQTNLSFVLGFGTTYPETRPVVLGTASTAARGEGKIAVDVLQNIVQRTWRPGAVCLFDVISEAVEAFPQLNIGGSKEDGQTRTADSSTTTTREPSAQETVVGDSATAASESFPGFPALSLRDKFGIDSPPDWVLSDVVTEKKSMFLGRAARVTSLSQAQAFLDHLVATDKKVAAATHNISAWRIKQKKPAGVSENNSDSDAGETVVQDYDDDGETAAGGRLLHVMQLMDVWDVVVVVSRWYGGIQLGPARFRLINDVGRNALVKGGFTHSEATGAGSEKSKKKDKK